MRDGKIRRQEPVPSAWSLEVQLRQPRSMKPCDPKVRQDIRQDEDFKKIYASGINGT